MTHQHDISLWRTSGSTFSSNEIKMKYPMFQLISVCLFLKLSQSRASIWKDVLSDKLQKSQDIVVPGDEREVITCALIITNTNVVSGKLEPGLLLQMSKLLSSILEHSSGIHSSYQPLQIGSFCKDL